MRRILRVVAALAVPALLASGCGVLGGGDDGVHITAYFPRAVSLFPSSQVRILGLPAGKVDEVVVEGDRVRVELTINGDVPVPADVHAMIVPQSLIGERYVQLTPAWTEGQPQAEDGHVIEDDGDPSNGREVIIPVEPDEALAALNEFLQSLDPEGLGRLIDNAATDLEGNGATLNSAFEGLGDLVDTFADRDQELGSLIDNFDNFTATLVTREAQLGEVIDLFSQATSVLAQERLSIERLLAALAELSEAGLDLVSEHAARLRTDLDTLARLGQSIVANIDSVTMVLDSGPLLVQGLEGAYNPTLRAMNLRNNFGPVIQEVLNPLLIALGLPPFPCVPVTQVCTASVQGASADTPAVPTDVVAGRTPVDDVLALLGAPGAPVTPRPRVSTADRIADGAGSVGRFLRDAAETLVGAS